MFKLHFIFLLGLILFQFGCSPLNDIASQSKGMKQEVKDFSESAKDGIRSQRDLEGLKLRTEILDSLRSNPNMPMTTRITNAKVYFKTYAFQSSDSTLNLDRDRYADAVIDFFYLAFLNLAYELNPETGHNNNEFVKIENIDFRNRTPNQTNLLAFALGAYHSDHIQNIEVSDIKPLEANERATNLYSLVLTGLRAKLENINNNYEDTLNQDDLTRKLLEIDLEYYVYFLNFAYNALMITATNKVLNMTELSKALTSIGNTIQDNSGDLNSEPVIAAIAEFNFDEFWKQDDLNSRLPIALTWVRVAKGLKQTIDSINASIVQAWGDNNTAVIVEWTTNKTLQSINTALETAQQFQNMNPTPQSVDSSYVYELKKEILDTITSH